MKTINSDDYKCLICRLRQARKDAGYNQIQAANALGYTQSFISKCESGERRIDVIELQKFCRLYNKSIFFFLPE